MIRYQFDSCLRSIHMRKQPICFLISKTRSHPPPLAAKAVGNRSLSSLAAAAVLPRHLKELDIFLEQVIDQRREVHPLGAGQRGQSGLHLLLQVHRQIQLRMGLVELTALAAREINLGGHVVIVI